MRLSANVNGTARVLAAVDGPGYLSAHLNAHDRPKDGDNSKTLQIKGIQTLDAETIFQPTNLALFIVIEALVLGGIAWLVTAYASPCS